MAVKLVDATQLDNNLTSIANAIRTKGGTSSQLSFPSGFVSGINNISGGADLNIEYSQTAPSDTTKLWVKCSEPSKVSVNTGLTIGSAYVETETTLPIAIKSACCASVGTNIYIFGGSDSSGPYNTIQKFNTLTESITTLSTTLANAIQNACCASVGTDVYIFGGYDGSDYRNEIQKFDTLTETITTLTVSIYYNLGYDCCASVGTDIYIFGGYNGSNTDKIQKFDTLTQSIVTLSATLDTAINGCCCASVGTDIYIFGGQYTALSQNVFYNTIQKFDTLTQTITTLSEVLYLRDAYFSCAAIGTDIYTFGGFNSNDKIQKFDTLTETITTLSLTIPYYVYNNCCATVGTKVFMFGGYNSSVRGYIDYSTKFYTDFTLTSGEGYAQIGYQPIVANMKLFNSTSLVMKIANMTFLLGNSSNIGEEQESYYYNGSAWVSTK